jgi:hypothetical protein
LEEENSRFDVERDGIRREVQYERLRGDELMKVIIMERG